MTDLFDRFAVIDVDTHLTEPPDLWTSRVPAAMQDQVPRIVHQGGRDLWVAGDQFIGAPGAYSMAGFDGVIPDMPKDFSEIPPAAYDAEARLAFLDEQGIRAQVLYPNVGGFGNGFFLRLGDRDVVAASVRAYNDFLTEWCSADRDRLLPVIATPFWDREFAVAEIERAAAMGHRAVNMCSQPQNYDEPPLGSAHWDPIWAAARATGLSVSFHIGGGGLGNLMEDVGGIGLQANLGKESAMMILDNMRCLGDLFFGGVCHRFPEVRFVSVESGVGWLPGVLEAFDWQWRNGGIGEEHPEYDLLPSDYFQRQVYACFWFERAAAVSAIERYPDNILYETDFPHPTCQHPGPRTPAQRPRDYATESLGGLSDDVLAKVLHDNAAALYGLP
jgi:predicted TIM-barrel fold metal-dependent hydrolase